MGTGAARLLTSTHEMPHRPYAFSALYTKSSKNKQTQEELDCLFQTIHWNDSRKILFCTLFKVVGVTYQNVPFRYLIFKNIIHFSPFFSPHNISVF